jgi:hypothetical protein
MPSWRRNAHLLVVARQLALRYKELTGYLSLRQIFLMIFTSNTLADRFPFQPTEIKVVPAVS